MAGFEAGQGEWWASQVTDFLHDEVWIAEAAGYTTYVFSEPGSNDVVAFWTAGPGVRRLTTRAKRVFSVSSGDYSEVPVFDLLYFGVDETRQGRGYGTFVHAHFQETIDACAFATRFLYLECWEPNPARAIYEQWGWRSVSRDRERTPHGSREHLWSMLLDRWADHSSEAA